LRKIVAALGGDLEVVVKFPSGAVKIGPFGSKTLRSGYRPDSGAPTFA
jgi:hypothetical protein